MPSTPNNGQQLYFNARSLLQLQWRRNDTTNGSLALHGDLAWLLIHVSVLYMCRMQYAVASLCVRCTMDCTMPHNTQHTTQQNAAMQRCFWLLDYVENFCSSVWKCEFLPFSIKIFHRVRSYTMRREKNNKQIWSNKRSEMCEPRVALFNTIL